MKNVCAALLALVSSVIALAAPATNTSIQKLGQGLLQNSLVVPDARKNIAFSPFAASIQSMMFVNGLADATEALEEMTFKDATLEEVNKSFKEKLEDYSKYSILGQEGFEIQNVTGVYSKNLELKEDYLNILSDVYRSETLLVPVVTEIKEKILDDESKEPVIQLLSSIVTRGVFTHKFSANQTQNGQFQQSDGGITPVSMMTQTTQLPYFEDERAQYVTLPFGTKRFVMDVVLPRPGMEVLAFASTAELHGILKGQQQTKLVRLNMPKFRIDSQNEISTPLRNFGLAKLLDGGADITPMTKDSIKFGGIPHNYHLEVSEDGANLKQGNVMSIPMPGSPIASIPEVTVNADRPFLVLIRDTTDGTQLFMGVVKSPAKR